MSSNDRTTEAPRGDAPQDDGSTKAFDQRIHEDERLAREDRLHRDPRDETTDDVADGAAAGPLDRRSVVAAERERFGGVKLGSAFFGWLTAMGTAVILTALLAAAGTAVGISNAATVSEVAADTVGDPATVGVLGAVALALVVFLAYYCGGYVAGRMARFDGARQGVAVWAWAVVVAVVVAVLGAVAGDQYNVLARLDGFPRVPVGEGDITTVGIIAVVVVLVTSLLGAILGGLAGMRFHRRVDRAGLGD
ncbi:hypothetical protein [Oryzobacter telluris]|uniref:hypothetical protein n=1 Tax=Oryzobacter telluris TaxID=3149179 RepID=UPI00370D12DD